MKAIIISLLVLFLFEGTKAQFLHNDVVATSGGFASVAEFSLSFTIGEAICNTIKGTSLTALQGFQQPMQKYDPNVPTAVAAVLPTAIKIYPNPANDFIVLENTKPMASVSLINLLGQRQSVKLDNNFFDIKHLQSGVYVIEIIENNQRSTHKIFVSH
jgi:Secretion system C-terminal sorting domain